MKTITRSLKRSDVGLRGEPELKLKSFQIILEVMVLSKTKIIEAKNTSPGRIPARLVGNLDTFYWRAKDSYIYKLNTRTKIPCENIYHQGLHYLLYKKFKIPLKGYPRFHMLSEAIATMAKLYFFIEVTSQEGLPENSAFVAGLKPAMREFLSSDKAVVEYLQSILNESCQNPYQAFCEAVDDMYAIYLNLFDVANKRMDGAEIPFHVVYDFVKKYKFGPLSYCFSIGSDMLYIMLYSGRRSSAKDRAAVKECFKLLKKSENFVDFIESLRLPIKKSKIQR